VESRLGIKVHKTTAYHPQANGLVERFHRSLKSSLKARLIDNNWIDELPWALLCIRCAPRPDLDASVAEIVYGEPLTLPGNFFEHSLSSPQNIRDAVSDRVSRFTPSSTSHQGMKHFYVPRTLADAQYVFIRQDKVLTGLQKPYTGPYRVISSGDKTFRVRQQEETISIDRLKPAHLDLDQPIQVHEPRRRGRPRKNNTPAN